MRVGYIKAGGFEDQKLILANQVRKVRRVDRLSIETAYYHEWYHQITLDGTCTQNAKKNYETSMQIIDAVMRQIWSFIAVKAYLIYDYV